MQNALETRRLCCHLIVYICLLVVVVVVLAGLTERVDALRTRLSETPERSLVEGTYIINNVVCLSSAMRRAISQLYYICAAFQCGSSYSNSVCPPSDVVFKPIFGIYILEHISQMLKLILHIEELEERKKPDEGRRDVQLCLVYDLWHAKQMLIIYITTIEPTRILHRRKWIYAESSTHIVSGVRTPSKKINKLNVGWVSHSKCIWSEFKYEFLLKHLFRYQ